MPSDPHPYDTPFLFDNVYGHALSLLARRQKVVDGRHIHLDLGCGFGHIAEPLVQQLGVLYVGVDADTAGLLSLSARGFETHQTHFRSAEECLAELRKILDGRPLASISMLDTLEQLPDKSVLGAIQSLAAEHAAPFVISVPNVTHRDVGIKLAFGRWDYADGGILDRAQLRFFTASALDASLREWGLHIVDSCHVHREKSDQHFPEDHPALTPRSLLGSILRKYQKASSSDAGIIQFVVLCIAGPAEKPRRLPAAGLTAERPFLSIITRTQGKRPHTLREVFVALAGQSSTDFEVLVMGHKLRPQELKLVERLIEDNPQWLREKIRLILVEQGNRTHPLNIGFLQARGHYMSILDDDDLPLGHWVESFQTLAGSNWGLLLRAANVRQDVTDVSVLGARATRAVGSPERHYPAEFELFDHLRENLSPPISFAFPRGVFHDLNIIFDETLNTAEDWDYIMQVAAVVGVASTPKITAIYRWWPLEHSSSRTEHSSLEWHHNRQRILQKLDLEPILLPAGSSARIRWLVEANEELSSDRAKLRSELRRLKELVALAKFTRTTRMARIRQLLEKGSHSDLQRIRETVARVDQLGLGDERTQQLELLRHSHLFDADWYRTAYSDIAESGIDPAEHYLNHGGSERRDPGPCFDARWYTDKYPDVLKNGLNPLVHYLHFGALEGRERQSLSGGLLSDGFREIDLNRLLLLSESSLFDDFWYLDQNPDIAESRGDPVIHYLLFGAEENRNPGPDFDGAWYLRHHSDLDPDTTNPLVHYLEHGVREGREIRPVLAGS